MKELQIFLEKLKSFNLENLRNMTDEDIKKLNEIRRIIEEIINMSSSLKNNNSSILDKIKRIDKLNLIYSRQNKIINHIRDNELTEFTTEDFKDLNMDSHGLRYVLNNLENKGLIKRVPSIGKRIIYELVGEERR